MFMKLKVSQNEILLQIRLEIFQRQNFRKGFSYFQIWMNAQNLHWWLPSSYITEEHIILFLPWGVQVCLQVTVRVWECVQHILLPWLAEMSALTQEFLSEDMNYL